MIQEKPLQQRLDEELARFKVLAEYGYSGSYNTPTATPAVLGEADDEEGEENGAPAEAPEGGMPADGADNTGAPEPGAPQEQGGEEPTQGEGDVAPAGPEEGMPGDDAGLGAGDVPPMPEEGGVNQDDTVIDVDDLTKAQEDINAKVNAIGTNVADVNAALTKILDRIDALDTRMDDNSDDIKDFYRELIKRNPTEVEKLQLRYKDSFPFNVNPDEYFDGKKTEPLVPGQSEKVEEDEEGRKKVNGQYVITRQDVESGINSAEVANSFGFNESACRSMKGIYEAVNSFEVEKTDEETKEEELLNKLRGKLIVYHFGNGTGTTGIKVGYVKFLDDAGEKILLTDEDGTRSIVIRDIDALINHAIPAPHASFYSGNTYRDGDGFAVMP